MSAITFDNGIFEGVKQVFVRDDPTGVVFLKIVYEDKNGAPVEVKYGVENGNEVEFRFAYPDEYITSFSWTWSGPDLALRNLVFKTSRGNSSRSFGQEKGISVPIKPTRYEARAIVGFRGRHSSNGLLELRANFGPAPPRKLKAIGGDGGEGWDDGKHESVTKIRVGRAPQGYLSYVQFDYFDGTADVVGEGHGTMVKTLGIDEDEFTIPHENDFLVSVEGYHDEFKDQGKCVTALQFKTQTGKISERYGMPYGKKFSLTGYNILGFHGRSSNKALHSLGAFVGYPPVRELSAEWIEVTQNGDSPGPRSSHAIAVVGNRIYSFGGHTSQGRRDECLFVFDYERKTWSRSPATGDVPNFSLIGASMVAIGSLLYVYGGKDESGTNSDAFHSFDTTTSEWKLITRDDGPGPRSYHSMAATESNVYVFGGVSTTGRPLKTLHRYSPENHTWSVLPALGDSFLGREGAALLVVEGKLWLVFGYNRENQRVGGALLVVEGKLLADIHCFDIKDNTWREVKTSGENPSPRSRFASAVSGKRILLFGGQGTTGLGGKLGGTFSLNTETLRWEESDRFGDKDAQPPTPRAWCASTTFCPNGGNEGGMVVMGGQIGSDALCNGLFCYVIE